MNEQDRFDKETEAIILKVNLEISTDTKSLTPKMIAEHTRLDLAWRQLVAERDKARARLSALHGKIMKLEVVMDFDGNGLTDDGRQAYRLGHRDARHAAAELCAAEVKV